MYPESNSSQEKLYKYILLPIMNHSCSQLETLIQSCFPAMNKLVCSFLFRKGSEEIPVTDDATCSENMYLFSNISEKVMKN